MLPGPFAWTAQSASTIDTMNYVDPEPSRDAKRWDAAEAATDFNFNLMAMSASLDLVVGFGDAVIRHSRQLIDALFARLPEHCTPTSPLEAERRGPFGCFVSRGPETTAALYERLRKANVLVSLRGGRIRVAPHLFNSIEDIERLVEVVRG
jgi:selenocysteine lyase/cysteine desulfurase